MITREEYELLKNYRDKGYKWIARDKSGNLFAFCYQPFKNGEIWNATEKPKSCSFISGRRNVYSFTPIKWEDEEPVKILDLIRDYEAHRVITQESKKVVIPECYEVLSDEWLAEHSEFADGIGEFYIYETLENMEKLLIPKTVKATVPQFVADWIEEVKGLKRNFKLEYLFDTTEMPDDVYDWLDERYGDTDILAKAWLDGYEVEQEKLYTVRLKNGYHLCKYAGTGVRWLNMTEFNTADCYKLTQAEIESVDPRLMDFAEEVE